MQCLNNNAIMAGHAYANYPLTEENILPHLSHTHSVSKNKTLIFGHNLG